MPDLAPLIATKFHIPPSRTNLVIRPRLRTLLGNGARQPLTLVSAPSGFGKTMLVSDWTHSQSGMQVAWLSLDESDNQPSVFWHYFVAALQRVQPNLGETAQAMLNSPDSPAIEAILATLVNELAALGDPLLLVLDDYHILQSPEIHHGLRFFIDHQPANFHLMVLTREDPPLDLARRRARHQMVEIRAADLRFNVDEAAMFLKNTMGLSLLPEQITTLEHRTEGWIVGLQMAGLSLQGRDPQDFFRSFKGDDRYIADYLAEEVLQRQPEPVRTFLLKTSILERMCASLCEALTGKMDDEKEGGFQPILDYLDRANLFIVPLDNRREWYRYHHLFAEFLRQYMIRVLPADEIASLHRFAAAWFEAHGDIQPAIRHARQIPDTKRVAQLLQRNVEEFFAKGELPRFYKLAQALPPAQREAYPSLSMAVAWAGLASSQPIEPWLQSIERHFSLHAEAALDDAGLDITRRAALLEVLIVRLQTPFDVPQRQDRARLLAIQHNLDALPPDQLCLFNTAAALKPVIAFDLGLDAEKTGEADLAARSFSEAIAVARQAQNTHLFQLAIAHLANIQTAQARLHAAFRTHEQALAQGARLERVTSPYAALAHAGLGALYYEWGDLRKAEKHLEEALPLARSWHQWESLIPLTLWRARIKYRLGEKQNALEILDELADPPVEGMLLPLEAKRAVWQAQNGDSSPALRWLAANGLAPTTEPAPLNEAVLLEVARILGLVGQLDESIALTRAIVTSAEAGGRIHIAIQGYVILAKAFATQGNIAQALIPLDEALRLAEPEGYLSTFVDEGDPIRRLLSKLPAESKRKAYADTILAGFGGEGEPSARQKTPGGLFDLLSDREREVLRLMADGLSNQDIAENLFISISTVKTHVGNIFNKLGVNSRTQAIARAETLGLLPPR